MDKEDPKLHNEGNKFSSKTRIKLQVENGWFNALHPITAAFQT